MSELKTKSENGSQISSRFEERLKNRLSIEGKSIVGSQIEHSNLFEKNNSKSDLFSILSIKFERATLREASGFKKFMEKAIAEDDRSIIVDLNSCEFVDSSFFGVLVGGVKRLRTMNKKFLLVYDSQDKLPIFSATGLDKVFKVYSTVDEAIKA
jgi:anti-sigma B factor antagonist